MEKDLSGFLMPKSVAVVGASRSPEKVGSIVLRNIKTSNFPGKVYAVNPNAQDIEGIQCFPDVTSLPETPDLAIIAIPAIKVNDVLKQVGEKGIKNAVVLSAGFKEIGEIGEKLEKELQETSEKYQLNMLGPNCLGFVNNTCPINATFGQSENINGNLRFISQSGAIASSLFDWCQSMEIGFSEFITLGNKAVVNENDVLEYFSKNNEDYPNAQVEGLSSVRPIGMYLEQISNGSEFLKLTREIGKKNPIFIIKPGKTKAAARAMQSHTGAIAGEDDVLESALLQAGIARCETLEDFFDLARAFSWENVPKGKRIAIISNAGGPAVISADAVVKAGLKLADFSKETKDELTKVLPRSASTLNPIDVLGDALADRYAAACETILQTDQADSLLIILTPQMMTQVEKTAEIIGQLSAKYKKPIFCSFIGGNLVNEGEKILNKAKIPSFRFPERAISTIGHMWSWSKRQSELAAETTVNKEPETNKTDVIKIIIENAVSTKHPALDSLEADAVAASLGIPTPPTKLAENVEDAKNFANNVSWPVVLKLTSSTMLHKAKFGGVVTGIWNENQLDIAWDRLNHKITELPENERRGIKFQIQKEVSSGIEVIVGIKHDPTFGPVLLFGAGGELAELVEDKNIKILPIDREQIIKLVQSSKVSKLFKNDPGEPPYALDKLYDLITKFTQIITLIPEAKEAEINPVIVTHNDVWAVDTKILLSGEEVKKTTTPQFHSATLKNATVLASKYRFLEFETEEPLDYEPGQYISVKVAPTRINSYSIAGGSGKPEFQLLVDTSPGGPGSIFFENIKPGDKMAYLGPFGKFTLQKDDGAERLLFLGTGSGCSPLRSILESALKSPDINIPIHFYFGLRHSEDVFWKEYFEKLSQEHPNFKFHLVLSKPNEDWQGPIGHITDTLKEEIKDASNSSAYLCGNSKMIEEASAILKNNNCPEDRIYTEKF
ncbi:acetate--CoA ligase family protein [Candidatus Woesebacteria bacterium]|nr:acetate--CoA ligase family protein [Candidatus Woesebacteria bacterium]